MNFEAQLIASFESLRQGDGLTIEKLRNTDHRLLLQMLGAWISAEEGYERLTKLVLDLRDSYITRAVRNALVIGDDIETRGGVEERRQWAVDPNLGKDALIPKSRSVHIRYEKTGFKALARKIIHQYPQRLHEDVDMGQMADDILQRMSSTTFQADEPDWEALAKEADDDMKWVSHRAQYAFAAHALMTVAFYMIITACVSMSAGERAVFSMAMFAVEILLIVAVIDAGRLPERPSVILASLFKLVGKVPSRHREY